MEVICEWLGYVKTVSNKAGEGTIITTTKTVRELVDEALARSVRSVTS